MLTQTSNALLPFLMQAATLPTSDYLTSPYIAWFPVVVAAAIFIISIVAIIYMICGMIGRDGLRSWAKMKIYDILMSFTLIIIFIFVANFMFQFDFQSLFNSGGLLTSDCVGTSLGKDLFSVAICNMYQFNQEIIQMNTWVYDVALALSFVPKLDFNSSALSPIPGVSFQVSIAPPDVIGSFSGTALNILFGAFVISQVQMLLLGASLLLFSLFMSIGLIARMFEVTKSFGGAMIAFGVGLGVVYPLLVCFTYGYLNVNLDANNAAVNLSQFVVVITAIIGMFLPEIYLVTGTATAFTLLGQLIKFIGLAVVGLSVIPMLNFIIVDVFISDFSKAVGEKINFLSLLTNIL
jgi:hypothetical protein